MQKGDREIEATACDELSSSLSRRAEGSRVGVRGQIIPPSRIVSPHPHWYLAEDFSFCERARQCGYKIWADTTIRLWHHGSYGYSWEDAGIDPARYDTFYFNVE